MLLALIAPIPRNVTVSPLGCQSLHVTWSPRNPTPPLTLFEHQVSLRTAEKIILHKFSTTENSYNITNLTPATNYSVVVRAQTQLGYGGICCQPLVSTYNGKACTIATDSKQPHSSLLLYSKMFSIIFSNIQLLTRFINGSLLI